MDQDTQQLKEKAGDWLDNPMDSGIHAALEHSENLLTELQQALRSNPNAGKTIGPLIGKVKGMQKRLNNIEPVEWVTIGDGRLAIGHRPGTKLISDIRLQGGTHILTLLSESEGAKAIEKGTRKEGMRWLWYGMSSAKPPSKDQMSELTSLFEKMAHELNNQARIYVHCSAGIHRTGMISYAFLRYLGISSKDAKATLKELRQTTREDVGEERLSWGEQFGDHKI